MNGVHSTADPTKSHSNLTVSESRGDRKPPTPTLGRIGLPVHDILGRSKTQPASHPHVHDHDVWEPANVCKSSHEDSPPAVKGIQEDDAFYSLRRDGFSMPQHTNFADREISARRPTVFDGKRSHQHFQETQQDSLSARRTAAGRLVYLFVPCMLSVVVLLLLLFTTPAP